MSSSLLGNLYLWEKSESAHQLLGHVAFPSSIVVLKDLSPSLFHQPKIEGQIVDAAYFRDKMLEAGFDIKPTQSAICAVMLYDAPLSQRYANLLLEEGIYVTGFYYPVVPKGEARIRVQLSAGHTREQLDKSINAFIKVGKELGVIK